MNGCSILEGLNERAYDGCIPLNVTLELTLRCNIRCTHCYNFDRDLPKASPGPELSMEEIRGLMDDLRRAGRDPRRRHAGVRIPRADDGGGPEAGGARRAGGAEVRPHEGQRVGNGR